jgi:hypothetical protein
MSLATLPDGDVPAFSVGADSLDKGKDLSTRPE